MLEELQQAVEKVARAVAPSVARIGRGPGRGGGVVIGEGFVLTNAHNLRGAEVTVTFADARVEKGSIAGVDVDSDLVVLKVPTGTAPPLEWRGGEATIGTAVFAVTLAAGAGPRVTFGTVSASGRAFRGPRGRLVRGGLEHTAPLTRGSSGSPVVGTDGRLIGVNTHRLGEGFYLAIVADAALRDRVDSLARGESPRRRYLGLSLLPAPAGRRLRAAVGLPEHDGLLVREVDDDGPGARAGVRRGDLLVEAGGRALASPDDLFEVLGALEDHEPLSIRALRATDEVEFRVTFNESPSEGAGTS